MFKVKATVVNMLGDTEKYPCHFNYKIGDSFIWTGAEFKGRICPAFLPIIGQKVSDLYSAGPRWVDSMYYVPFWYSPPSVYDPSLKKYDGIGFKPVFKTIPDIKYGMSVLRDPNSFKWPPHPERTVSKDIMVTCPDYRTSVVLKLEAFDLADDGDCITYFRRMMVILHKVQAKGEVEIKKIIDEFSPKERDEIYPPLSQILIDCLVEELELIGYMEIKKNGASVTDKGKEKLKSFVASLDAEEREALGV
jgi:uncharacterized repeat protein (TIGR04076 family)